MYLKLMMRTSALNLGPTLLLLHQQEISLTCQRKQPSFCERHTWSDDTSHQHSWRKKGGHQIYYSAFCANTLAFWMTLSDGRWRLTTFHAHTAPLAWQLDFSMVVLASFTKRVVGTKLFFYITRNFPYKNTSNNHFWAWWLSSVQIFMWNTLYL